VFRAVGWVSPVVLVGGRVGGVWGSERVGERLEVSVEAFGPITAAQRKAVADEADRLGTSLARRHRDHGPVRAGSYLASE
jgi:hypothetical protein